MNKSLNVLPGNRPPFSSRRGFLKTILAAGAAAYVSPLRLKGSPDASGRITLGFIGVGSHGTGVNLVGFLNQPDAQVVAVCDVYADRRAAAREKTEEFYKQKGCREVADFREIISDPAIDAVVISTPDHWHLPISLLALEAGKDVFSEKPTLTIDEGRELLKAVGQKKAVFQAGIEDRSCEHYHKMVEWVRNGAIGKVKHVEVLLPSAGAPDTGFPVEESAPVPAGLDYGMWLGPAPFHPYTPMRTNMWHWRHIRDYSGGSLTDWGAHLVDTAQLLADAPGVCPVEVEGTGTAPQNSQSTVPIVYDLHYRYENGVTMRVGRGPILIRVEGDNGWISITEWKGKFEASDPGILRLRYEKGTSKYGLRPPSEHRNFLDCVKSRGTTTYSPIELHRLCTTLHMGAIALETGRKLSWDNTREEFIGDVAANALQYRTRRNDWQNKT